MDYIAVFALSSNPRNIIANISTRACNLIKCIHCATGMRFKLDEMFALFLGQQYDTLMNGLTKDEATATCVNFMKIKGTAFAKITTLKCKYTYIVQTALSD